MLVVAKVVVVVAIVALLIVRLLVQRRRATSEKSVEVNTPLTIICGIVALVLIFLPLHH